mmetsp:Transcript_56523/g.120048  ORF Transcript_56523/g.120048 Transcript_56523/m.120048 type:complete len:368 (+) Transcript_56523:1213-2316(+)
MGRGVVSCTSASSSVAISASSSSAASSCSIASITSSSSSTSNRSSKALLNSTKPLKFISPSVPFTPREFSQSVTSSSSPKVPSSSTSVVISSHCLNCENESGLSPSSPRVANVCFNSSPSSSSSSLMLSAASSLSSVAAVSSATTSASSSSKRSSMSLYTWMKLSTSILSRSFSSTRGNLGAAFHISVSSDDRRSPCSNMSFIAGTFRRSSSAISPSLQCLEKSACSASPSEAGGYSTPPSEVDDDSVAAAGDEAIMATESPLSSMTNGTLREIAAPALLERVDAAGVRPLVSENAWILRMQQPASAHRSKFGVGMILRRCIVCLDFYSVFKQKNQMRCDASPERARAQKEERVDEDDEGGLPLWLS